MIGLLLLQLLDFENKRLSLFHLLLIEVHVNELHDALSCSTVNSANVELVYKALLHFIDEIPRITSASQELRC